MAHVKLEDCACKCGRADCDAPPMDEAFLTKAEDMLERRVKRGKKVPPITSGSRCKVHNADPHVHGAENSQHLYGKALDFGTVSREEAEELKQDAIAAGMGGIGTGSKLIHVDDGPPHRRWTYP